MEQMSNLEMAEVLQSLVQMDVGASRAYGQAIENIELIALREKFQKFRSDHEQHVLMLNKVIHALGIVPPGYSQDFKGLLMEGWAAFRGSTGIEGALKAMKTNAEHITKKYREASALPFTPHIGTLVERNYQNVRMHLEFIEKALATRIWEKAA
jgi:hypothetical protein